MSRPRLRLALPLAATVLVLLPSAVLAHAELESATPAPGSTVTVAPTELVATFTEAIDGSKSSLEVRDAAGSVVASGGADVLGADRLTMTLPLPALADGAYEVRWTSAALDGHIERGTFEFTVALAPSPSPSPSASQPPSPATSATPTASAAAPSAPAASASASASPTPSGASGGSGSLDAATLAPIAAALVVVAALATYFVRSRRQ